MCPILIKISVQFVSLIDSLLLTFLFCSFLDFFTLKSAADACLFKKVPMLGISTLIDAIQWYTNGHPEVLTPAHASLLCLCLKARHFYLCDPFINIDPEALLQQVSLKLILLFNIIAKF